MEKKKNRIKTALIHLGFIVLASMLFAASFPNLVFENGLPFLAWFAYIPALIVIRKNGFIACAVFGAIYGYTAYTFFNYWLSAFNPLSGIIVCGIYSVFLLTVFIMLKLADVFFPGRSYIAQWIIWLAYEYLCTLGFLGYSYGVTGYSQWRIIPLIQIAGVTGVWGVSALVTFPSFWLAQALKTMHKSVNYLFEAITLFLKKEKVSVIIWASALTGTLIFGFSVNKDFSSYPAAQIALVQHNTDPWLPYKLSNTDQRRRAYQKDLTSLKNLSEEALSSVPKPQLVVWPETAFIPRIYWHKTYRDDQDSWLLVKELLDYLSSKDIPFLIGNDDARRDPSKNPRQSENYRVDYNGVLLFEKGEIKEIYRKLRLVPFTEHFPYKKQFPLIYEFLEKADTHFWEKGEEETVFKGPGFSFSAPVCFEDTFGYLSGNFVRRGADILINLSNDAWSNSLPAQNQHLSMAVFRAIENRRSMVRSTASGQTCAIDPCGRIIDMAPPFAQAMLNVSVPLVKEKTLYTLYGDYTGVVFTFFAIVLLLIGTVSCTIKKLTREGKR
jgi:apolipoprotein N-acyltransferase